MTVAYTVVSLRVKKRVGLPEKKWSFVGLSQFNALK